MQGREGPDAKAGVMERHQVILTVNDTTYRLNFPIYFVLVTGVY